MGGWISNQRLDQDAVIKSWCVCPPYSPSHRPAEMGRLSKRCHSMSGRGVPVAAHLSRKFSPSFTMIAFWMSPLMPIIEGGIKSSLLYVPFTFTFHAFIPGIPGVPFVPDFPARPRGPESPVNDGERWKERRRMVEHSIYLPRNII